jgi:hypothetical protein
MLRRWMGQCLAILATGLVGVVVAPGCSEVDSMLFIRQVLATKPPDCTVRAGVDSLSYTSGAFDASLKSEYTAQLLVGNQLVARGSSDLVRTESNKVALKSAEVTVLDANDAQLDSFSVPVTGFVDEAQGSEASFGLASVTLVSSRAARLALGLSSTPTAEQLAKAMTPKRVVTRVRVFGQTLGGSDVQSNEFQFIVFVCRGCLVSYPAGVDPDPTDDKLECTGTGLTDVDPTSVCCSPGQDCVSDCRTVGALPLPARPTRQAQALHGAPFAFCPRAFRALSNGEALRRSCLVPANSAKSVDQEHHGERDDLEIEVSGDDDRALLAVAEAGSPLEQQPTREAIQAVVVEAPAAPEHRCERARLPGVDVAKVGPEREDEGQVFLNGGECTHAGCEVHVGEPVGAGVDHRAEAPVPGRAPPEQDVSAEAEVELRLFPQLPSLTDARNAGDDAGVELGV